MNINFFSSDHDLNNSLLLEYQCKYDYECNYHENSSHINQNCSCYNEDDYNFSMKLKEFDYMNTEILEKLGENSTHKVYRAIKKNTLETSASAVKFLKVNKNSKKRFFELSQLLLEDNDETFALKQKGIFKDKTSSHTFVIEMEEGVCTLADLITKTKKLNKTFEISEIVHILKQLSKCLSFLHSQGIMHSDIKPNNIMIFKKDNNEFFFKIIDFDTSIKLQKHNELTTKDQILGFTKAYASPEISMYLRDYEKIDLNEKINLFKSDVFSLGKTFQDLMKISKTNTIRRKSNEILQNFDDDEEIHSRLMQLINEMIENDPEKRVDCCYVKFYLEQLFSKEPELIPEIVQQILVDKEKKISFNENLRLFQIYLQKFANFELAKKYLDQAFAKINKPNYKSSNLAKYYKNLGFFCQIQGNYKQAEENYLKSYEFIEKIDAEENDINQRIIIEIFDNLGNLYKKIGDYKKAEDFFVKQLEKTLKLSKDREIYLSKAHINLSSLYYYLGKLHSAESHILKSYMILSEMSFFRQKTIKISNESPVKRYRKHFEYKENLAFCYQNMGLIYLKFADSSIAEEFFIKALEIMSQIYVEKHYSICEVKDALALLYLTTKNKDQFNYYFFDSKRMKKELLGKNHLDYAFSLDLKSLFYRENDIKQEKNEEILLKSAQIKEKILGEDHRFALQVQEKLANLYEKNGETIKAMRLQEEILEKRKQKLGEFDKDTAQSFHNIGLLLFKKEKNYIKARDFFEKSLEIKEKIFSPNDLANKMTIGTLEYLSSIYAKQNLFEKAENAMNMVLNYREEMSFNGAFYLKETIDALKNLLYFNEKTKNNNNKSDKSHQIQQKKNELEKKLQEIDNNLITPIKSKTFLKERMDEHNLKDQTFKKERI